MTSSAPVALLATWPGDQEWLAVNSSQHTVLCVNKTGIRRWALMPILTPHQVSVNFQAVRSDVVLAAFKMVAAKNIIKTKFSVDCTPEQQRRADPGFGVGVSAGLRESSRRSEGRGRDPARLESCAK